MTEDIKVTRLSKAAREFNVGISTIVEFLHKKGFNLDPNPNTKLPHEAYTLLVKEYSTDISVKKESEKLILKDYIDRISLIYEMSKVDFVINVDTIHDDPINTEAIPSKLIDYALSGRPILNINSASLDEVKAIEFLERKYSKQRTSKNNRIGKANRRNRCTDSFFSFSW